MRMVVCNPVKSEVEVVFIDAVRIIVATIGLSA